MSLHAGVSPPPVHVSPSLQGEHSATGEWTARAEAELQLSFLPNETLVWQQGPVIGTGRFGQVMLALRIPSAEFLAVKQIYIQEEIEQGNNTSSLCMQRVLPLSKIQREVDIIQSIHHPNIVQCIGCERYGPVYRLFMEFVPAGSLSKLLKELGPFQESAVRHFVRQLTHGVAYLHRVGVAHRDLKCANLLLADDGTLKIADFGSATRASSDHDHNDDHDHDHDQEINEQLKTIHGESQDTARSVRDGLGSPYWMAPELVRAERGADAWRKADVWGIGCVMLELLTGKPPWDNHSNPLTAMFHIASHDAIPSLPSTLSPYAASFLGVCFEKNPTTRATAMELLMHPFLTGDPSSNRRESKPQRSETALTAETAVTPSKNQRAQDHGLQGDSNVSLNSSSSTPATTRRASALSSSSSPSIDGSDDDNDDSDAAVDDAAAYSSEEDTPPPPPVAAIEALPFPTSARGEPSSSSFSSSSVSRRPSASTFEWAEIGRVRALATYTPSDINELALREGETLAVAGVNEFGWWRGRHVAEPANNGDTGWFPCTYVEWLPRETPFLVREPHVAAEDSSGLFQCLELTEGDRVDVLHCEWRDERLWAFGARVGNGDQQQGWFPFSCVAQERAAT